MGLAGVQTGIDAVNATKLAEQGGKTQNAQAVEAARVQQNETQRRTEQAQTAQKIGDQPLAKEGALGTRLNAYA